MPPPTVDDTIGDECLRQAAPLTRSLALLSPASALLMLLISRDWSWPALGWAAVLVASGWLVAMSMPGADAPGGELRRWGARYPFELALTMLLWAGALLVLAPPADRPAVQTAQLLVVVAVGNTLVLVGAFMPRAFHVGLLTLGVAVCAVLAVEGLDDNRFLAVVVPAYMAVLWQLQVHMRAATVRSIGLAIENDELLDELGRERERLHHQATHDHLTGLANRAEILARLRSARAGAEAGQHLALAFLDLDRFKEVNDVHGHATGDRLLQLVAARLRGAVRDRDVVGRFGGDEFTVLFDRVEDLATVRVAGERLLAAVAAPFVVGGAELPVGVSIGIGTCAAGTADEDTLIATADRALYEAKDGGRGRMAMRAVPPAGSGRVPPAGPRRTPDPGAV